MSRGDEIRAAVRAEAHRLLRHEQAHLTWQLWRTRGHGLEITIRRYVFDKAAVYQQSCAGQLSTAQLRAARSLGELVKMFVRERWLGMEREWTARK